MLVAKVEFKRLGPFEILGPLGQGGMGTVFRARQEPFGRLVALKVLRGGGAGDTDSERRFAREIELAAGLSHPHLVKVLDGGTLDGVAYIAMELVEGDTLAQVADTAGRVAWAPAAAIVSRLAAALEYLHERDILHRDVKTTNALLSSDGWVKLMDFGLARWNEATVMTADGAVVGTLSYLPPEMLEGASASVAGELWSLGCVLYRLLTGRMHIDAASQKEWMMALSACAFPRVEALVPETPPELAALAMQMLDRDPKKRPATAGEVEERLDEMLTALAGATWDQVLTGEVAVRLLGRGAGAEPRAPSDPTAPTPRVPRRLPSGGTPQPAGQATPRGMKRPPVVRARGPLEAHAGGGGAAGTAGLRAGALAAAGGLALFAMALFAFRAARAPEHPVDASPAPPASAASPAPAIVAPQTNTRAHPLTENAAGLERYLPRLRLGGKSATRAIEELKPLVPLKLGEKACVWISWLEIEAWLADARRAASPARAPCANAGNMDIISEQMFIALMAGTVPVVADPAITPRCVQFAGEFPDDGRPWLMLGRMYELDGRAAEAPLLYALGLARLGAVRPSHKGELMWAALARALLTVPGRSLEREWWRLMPDGKESRRALYGLRSALGPTGMERYDAMLASAPPDEERDEWVAIVRAELLEDQRLEPEQARKLLVQYLENHERAGFAADRLMTMHLARGNLAVATQLLQRYGGAEWLWAFLDYARGHGDPSVTSTKHSKTHRERVMRWEAFRQLELGHFADAATQADALRALSDDSIDVFHRLAVDLIGRAPLSRVFTEAVRDSLERWKDAGAWAELAGTLAGPERRDLMQTYLALAAPEALKGRARALWLSRCGRHAAALKALDALVREQPDEDFRGWTDLGEVACRPLWEKLAGLPVPDDVLAHARRAPVPPPVRALHDALARDDAGASRTASWALFDLAPARGIAVCAAAWLQARTGPEAEWPAARDRLLAAVRTRGHGLWLIEEVRRAGERGGKAVR